LLAESINGEIAMNHRCLLKLALLPLAISGAIGSSAHAQDATATAAGNEKAAPVKSKQMQTVVVTGTRSTGRTEAESLSPIDVLNSDDLTATGANDIATALNKLLPSLDFPSSSINGPLSTVQPVILRGISPNYVLILVDGKRYHTSAQVNYSTTNSRGAQAVDIASIPVAAVDHIEVLRDGAAAQYGSDAIAGVVNIVLKHGAKAGTNSITAGIGSYTKGGGDQNSVSGSVGVDLGGNKQGWLRLSWNYLNTMPTNHAEFGDQTNLAVVAANGGYARQIYGSSGQKTGQAVLNFEYNLAHNVTLYGYLDASRRQLTNYGYYRTANASNNVKEVYPDGYLPLMPTESNDFSSALGLKGQTDSGWHWDLSGVYGTNNIANQVDNSINVALYRNTGSSPSYMNVGTWRDSQGVVSLDLSKDMSWAFLPNPVTVAFGGAWMKDQFKIIAGEPDSYYTDPAGKYPGGAQTFFGLTPASAGNFGRYSQSAYVDLETDLTDKLSAGVAGRYEHYSDAGATRSGKLSARYQFTDSFALRGTASNGFRAPSLGQQYYQTISTIINSNVLTQTGTFRTSSPVAVALGAQPLKPEKSTSYSLGGVWQPINDLSLTVDAYQIRISHQILLSDSFSLAQNPALASYVATVSSAQIGAAQYFANAATTRARGVDAVASYFLDFGNKGTLRLSASGNYNKTTLLNVAATPQVLQQYAPTIALYGRASEGLLTKSTPRTKYVLSGTWAVDDWSFYTGLTRYGSVMRVGNTAAGDQKFSARWLLDMSASYTYRSWTFSGGVNNLTNQYPTRVSANNTYDYYHNELPYSPLSPFGFNGRYVFANATFRW
jgi:iron complex outermembrane receptor protein